MRRNAERLQALGMAQAVASLKESIPCLGLVQRGSLTATVSKAAPQSPPTGPTTDSGGEAGAEGNGGGFGGDVDEEDAADKDSDKKLAFGARPTQPSLLPLQAFGSAHIYRLLLLLPQRRVTRLSSWAPTR